MGLTCSGTVSTSCAWPNRRPGFPVIPPRSGTRLARTVGPHPEPWWGVTLSGDTWSDSALFCSVHCQEGTLSAMPVVTSTDLVLLHIATSKSADISALPKGGRYPFPIAQLLRQVVMDRLLLAGEHLRAGDHLLFSSQYRSAISRHYYAMYHGARAIVFAENRGDDYERHNVLPRNLPANLPNAATRETELIDARLLRNQADYDAYPLNESDWEADARALAVTAANFLQDCESFASENGYI